MLNIFSIGRKIIVVANNQFCCTVLFLETQRPIIESSSTVQGNAVREKLVDV